jgi:uracil-DNA glycosylase family 4
MRVDGYGPSPCEWMIIGEGPGIDEDRKGRPFVGKTGKEMRRYFNDDDLPGFDDVFATNVYRHYMGRDYEYTAEDLAEDEPYLVEELHHVQPSIFVAVGRYATRWLLGDVAMDAVHGLPWILPTESRAWTGLGTHTRGPDRGQSRSHPTPSLSGRGLEVRRGTDARSSTRKRDVPLRCVDEQRGRHGSDLLVLPSPVVFPCYHPAAGFRSPEASALVAYDFVQLAAFAAGDLTPRALFDDPIPDPTYREVTDLVNLRTWLAAH